MNKYVLTPVLLFLGTPLVLWAQNSSVTVSGSIADQSSHSAMGYVNVIKSYLYSALFHRMSDATITRIASTLPGTTLIYHVMQNAGHSFNAGVEMLWSQEVFKAFSFQFNLIAYRNQIDAFSVFNLYPRPNSYTSETQEIYSGSIKWNGLLHLPNQWNAQFSTVYLAPDLIPQGKIGQRFSFDLGLKKSVNQGKGEYFINATDVLNSMVIRKDIQGKDFNLHSSDYYETQVIRIGFAQKF